MATPLVFNQPILLIYLRTLFLQKIGNKLLGSDGKFYRKPNNNTVSNLETGIRWGKGIINQGKPWEKYVQSTLPKGTIDLNKIKSNFKTFDHLTPEGKAVSSKTLDTVNSISYQKPQNITRQLNQYIDQMENFKRDGKVGGFVLSGNMIKSKEMQLGIPEKTTSQQMQAIQQSIQYAKSKNITLTVIKVK